MSILRITDSDHMLVWGGSYCECRSVNGKKFNPQTQDPDFSKCLLKVMTLARCKHYCCFDKDFEKFAFSSAFTPLTVQRC